MKEVEAYSRLDRVQSQLADEQSRREAERGEFIKRIKDGKAREEELKTKLARYMEVEAQLREKVELVERIREEEVASLKEQYTHRLQVRDWKKRGAGGEGGEG